MYAVFEQCDARLCCMCSGNVWPQLVKLVKVWPAGIFNDFYLSVILCHNVFDNVSLGRK